MDMTFQSFVRKRKRRLKKRFILDEDDNDDGGVGEKKKAPMGDNEDDSDEDDDGGDTSARAFDSALCKRLESLPHTASYAQSQVVFLPSVSQGLVSKIIISSSVPFVAGRTRSAVHSAWCPFSACFHVAN